MAVNPESPASCARHSSSSLAALTVYGLTIATFFAASSAPTPLYRRYQELWGFSSGTLTMVFGIYAFSLLLALLTTGSLSDHVGRRPVMLGAVALEAVSTLVFFAAADVSTLIVARVLQGFATGVAASVLGAAMLDVNRVRGPLVNSIAPVLGMGAGALGSSILVQHAPAPLRLVYALLFAVFLLQFVAVLRLPETVERRAGAWGSLTPRVRVPRAARAALLRVAPVDVAIWALGGFYLSLGPTLARAVTGSDDVTMGGWVVFVLTFSGAAAVLLLRAWPASRLLMYGALALSCGLVVTLLGIHSGIVSLFFLGPMIAGTGFGTAFQGALRSVLPLAEPHERAGLMAAFYVLSYLAFSIPAIAAGIAAHALGLRPTTDAYGITLVVLALITLVCSGVASRRRTVKE